MGFYRGPKIVTNGLTLYYDPANTKSYPGTGTTMSDIVGSTSATLVNSPTYNTSNKGNFIFNGTTTRITFNNTISETSHTVITWVKADAGALQNTTSTASRKTPFVGNGPIWNPGYWLTGIVFRVHAKTEYRDLTISLVNDTNWHMLGQTYDGTTCYHIVDGVRYLGTRTAYAPASFTTAVLGGENTGASSTVSWAGSIGVTQVYNRPITEAEILQNFNSIKSRYGY